MEPAEAYLICATPRSGSTLLCDLLTETDVAGRPESYYRRESIPQYVELFGLNASETAVHPAFDGPYLTAVKQAGSANTGVFGMRIMWGSLADLLSHLRPMFPTCRNDAAVLERAFGRTLFIYLSRRDKVAQAVSLLRARQTGLWHRAHDGGDRERSLPETPPGYDYDTLAALSEELQNHDQAWETWFESQGIVPFKIAYEDLAEAPITVVEELLAALGLDRNAAASAEVRTSRLADEVSTAWIARFRSEHAG